MLTSEGSIPRQYGSHSHWCRNVLARRGCTVAVKGEELTLTAPELVPASTAELLVPARNGALWHGLGIQQYLRLTTVNATAGTQRDADLAAA